MISPSHKSDIINEVINSNDITVLVGNSIALASAVQDYLDGLGRDAEVLKLQAICMSIERFLVEAESRIEHLQTLALRVTA